MNPAEVSKISFPMIVVSLYVFHILFIIEKQNISGKNPPFELEVHNRSPMGRITVQNCASVENSFLCRTHAEYIFLSRDIHVHYKHESLRNKFKY